LINNAGIILASTMFEEVSDNQFAEITRVNLWGVLHGIRVFLPHLKRRPQSSIVNISSLAGLIGLRGYSPYVMTKFAIRGLSEAAPSGVRRHERACARRLSRGHQDEHHEQHSGS
jgi:NAD(P)-dependent dehydrogenase (short-subunit alcohol dehydrogenase family)